MMDIRDREIVLPAGGFAALLHNIVAVEEIAGVVHHPSAVDENFHFGFDGVKSVDEAVELE